MNIIAFDTETRGFDWWDGQTAFIATTADATREYCYDLSDPPQALAFQRQLCNADAIVAHNLSFDVHQVRATTGFNILDLDAALHDTDLMARVFLPEGKFGEHGGFGLKNLAKVYLDPSADTEEQGIKDAGKAIGYRTLNKTGAYFDVWRAYPEVMEKYARADARYTYDLYLFLLREYNDPAKAGQASIYDLEREVVPLLIQAEARGTAVDPPAVKRLHKAYLKEQKRLRDSLARQLGEEALGGEGSEEALVEALQSNGVTLTERTETGKLSTAAWVLEKQAADHPVVAEFLEYRHVNKFLSTYIERMMNGDVIHPNFRQIGAWTGRMSCTNPNMQNIPVRAGSEVREVLVARPGYKLVVADFDSIEMRILAYYLGPEGQPYRDLINSGLDPHAWMAAELARQGVAPWAGTGTAPADFTKGAQFEYLRADAKRTLFSIVYGAGGGKLCQYLKLPTGPPLTDTDWVVQRGYKRVGEPSNALGNAVAKAIKGSIPGYGTLMRRVRNKVEAHGFLTTLGGRHQALARDKGYVGMSALVQGSAADVMKSGLVQLKPVLDSFDAHLLLVVHDEVVIEAREDQAEDVREATRLALESSWEIDPPLLVTASVADNYGEAK